MTTYKLLISGVMFGLSSLFSQSYAALPPMLPPMNFFEPTAITTFDKNGDGKVSPSEWTAARTAEFATIDTNNSGDLTLAELDAHTSKQAAKLINLDTDSNGQLSLAEFVSDKTGDLANVITEIFHLADSDVNDVLNATELALLSPSSGDVIRYFAMLDQNYDLVVSQSEYVSPPPKSLPKRPAFGKTGDRPMMR